ncbi:MAG: hypothetical protein RIB86_01865, partial [Imperialibacter sp.]
QNFLNPKLKVKSETITPIIVQNSIDIRNNLSFSLNFSYRIGKITTDGPQRRRKSIQNDDLKGDGGDSDGGGAAPAAPAATQRRGRGN